MTVHDGQLDLCPHQGCSFACCNFAADNFIVLYPGEVEEVRHAGKSIAHLDLLSDAQGGYKAICRAEDTSTCDEGHKPLDCASYPFFPTINAKTGQIQVGLKGEKCPLQQQHLVNHRQWVLQRWQVLVNAVPGIMNWIRQTRLVGYVSWSEDIKSEELIQ